MGGNIPARRENENDGVELANPTVHNSERWISNTKLSSTVSASFDNIAFASLDHRIIPKRHSRVRNQLHYQPQ